MPITTQNNKNYVIFAPHIDDEIIGCWSFIKAKIVDSVYYFYDLDDDRKKEAKAAAFAFGYTAVFETSYPLSVPNDKTILLPNIRDAHPDHKQVNRNGKYAFPDHKKMFYSVDMNYKTTLLDDWEDKRDTLNKFFPSQSELFRDGKYYLFESIQDTDVSRYTKVSNSKVVIEIAPPLGNHVKKLLINDINSVSKDTIIALMNSKYAEYEYKLDFGDEVIYSGNFNN